MPALADAQTMRQIPLPWRVSKKAAGNTTGRSVSGTGPNPSLLPAGRKKVRRVRRRAHQERRHAMRCARGGGLMVREKFEDLGGLGSIGHEYAGWRCINCGSIVDPVIAAHRRLTSQAAASDPALTTA